MKEKTIFYPDLPKGYQISQYQSPMGRNGFLEIQDNKKIRIERVHLEEDTGKLLHTGAQKSSLVDFNRAGVPLMEIVTEPDIFSAKEAREFIKELQTVLRYNNVSMANMEKGEMRAEVNISIAKADNRKLGTKVEIKNLNSIKADAFVSLAALKSALALSKASVLKLKAGTEKLLVLPSAISLYNFLIEAKYGFCMLQ